MKVYQMLRKSILSMIIHGSMIGSGLVMVGSALTPATASASSHEDFNFTNNTGTTITGLYMAPHGTNQSWGHKLSFLAVEAWRDKTYFLAHRTGDSDLGRPRRLFHRGRC
jgi:hypothetical protein